MILALSLKSLRNRRFTALLTILSIALSVALLLTVERFRHASRESFTATVSGTDLIVGARSAPVQLLLSSVFHLGNATNNLRWDSFQGIAGRPEVAWTIPLSLGDTHRGFRVLGTSLEYFAHFRFGRAQALQFAQGRSFDDPDGCVLGAEVARDQHYKLGDRLVIAHGAGEATFSTHDQHPFIVIGILTATGTPVDRVVHVSLEGIDAIHEAAGVEQADPLALAMRAKTSEAPHESTRTITAALIGLRNRAAALSTLRALNEYKGEPLTAIMPGATLAQLWEVLGTAERTLFAVSWLVVIVGMAGMLIALLTGLSERRREMAVLRSVGARPTHIAGLILGEATVITLCGILIGLATLYTLLSITSPWIRASYGLFIENTWPSAPEWKLMAMVLAAGVIIGLLPARRMYRYSLIDGMSTRL